jgi:murein DD-endopeptidase MepM/ murein hydrolase activator NlpD
MAGVLLGAIATANASTGGTYASAPGAITAIGCSTDCSGLSLARTGSTIRIDGTTLGEVEKVVFFGAHGSLDDADVVPESVSATEVLAVVPPTALSGPIGVVNGDGAPSAPSSQALAVTTAPAPTTGAVQAQVSAAHVYFDGTNPATLRYFVDSAQASTVTVTLVRGTSATQLQSWGPAVVQPGTVGSITWAGTKTISGGGVAPEGRYTFQVAVAGTGGTRVLGGPQATTSFSFLPDVFPVQGKYTFNLGAGRFDAARAGHVHEGQDVMANCGTPLVAARGGTVEKVAVDVNAGNYIVIDAAGTGVDMVYAHLREPSPLHEGDPVLSGQHIGIVGRTGDATACHLHFEEWTAPGWFKGGHPYDPLPDLRAWAREAKAAQR